MVKFYLIPDLRKQKVILKADITFCKESVLSYFDILKPIRLKIDASSKTIEDVLYQQDFNIKCYFITYYLYKIILL